MIISSRVISFSLWGGNAKYTVGAVENAKLAKEIYPDWLCRFYIGKSTYSEAPDTIIKLSNMSNVQIIEMDEDGDWSSMFWRFLPCSDGNVDIMLSRDCDSRLSYREKQAVDEWLLSSKSFHIMRDHPYHTVKILGGMWGARTEILRDMIHLISSYNTRDYWQIDQEFLSEVIYPRISGSCYVHDEFYGGKSFPGKRVNYHFIGEAFNENNVRNANDWEVLRDSIKTRRKWYSLL